MSRPKLWPQRQRLGDLDQLALSDGKIADPRAAVAMRADRGQLLGDPRAAAVSLRAAVNRHAIEQVLGDVRSSRTEVC
jgi:hypothetical protein